MYLTTIMAKEFHQFLYIFITIIALSFGVNLKAEQKLNIVICVDGLSSQAMDQMRQYWPQGGLRQLDEEAHESTITFDQLVYGGDETLATILTGTTPDNNGYTSDYIFNRKSRKVEHILIDDSQKGIGTDAHLSPKALLSPTIADEFIMSHTNRSKVFAVGINPTTTILLAGHAANACTWLNTKTMHWASTGYYSGGLPSAADEMNVSGRIGELTSQTWTPRMDIDMYMCPTDNEKKKSFSYNQQDYLRQSPVANTLVIEMALALQQKEGLGTNQFADMLLLELNVNSPKAISDHIQSAEQEDMYLRLNQDLGWMMEQLDKRIGKDNYRIILFGKPLLGSGSNAFERVNMPTNYFNTERASALINTYLMAMYGHERWIDGGYANSIYLNRTLIEQKKMNISNIEQQVSSFLLEFEGPKTAISFKNLQLLPNGGEEEKLRRSLNKHTAGDVVFVLEPLWLIGENASKRIDNVPDNNPTVPLMVWTTERTTMPEREIKATDVKRIVK